MYPVHTPPAPSPQLLRLCLLLQLPFEQLFANPVNEDFLFIYRNHRDLFAVFIEQHLCASDIHQLEFEGDFLLNVEDPLFRDVTEMTVRF
jgi:hypothetical protein